MSQRWRHYDRMAAHLAPAAERLLARVGPMAGLVIDLGSGSGNGLRAAAAVGRPIVGIDLAAEQLAAARPIGVPLVRGDVTTLPIRTGSAAAAVSNFAVIFAADRPAVFAEVARGLRPGGRFAFTAWTDDGWPQPAREALAAHLDRRLPPFPTDLGRSATAEAMLVDAGFGSIEVEHGELAWTFADIDVAVDELSEAAGGLRLLRRDLEAQGRWTEAAADLRAVIEPRCQPTGGAATDPDGDTDDVGAGPGPGVIVVDRYVLYVAEVP
ncbi:MAG: class I SAM-dependent methyltransferase [Actinomycetota bacterium]